MNEIFFTADTHFGHRRMLDRGFASVDDMDEALIRNWNAAIARNDIVYHLGDLSFHKSVRTLSIVRRLHGEIRFVRGNHDRKFSADLAARISWTKDYHELRLGSRKVVLSHYPLEIWNKAHHGSWHLHGHSHGNLTSHRPCRMDVGVDTHELRPWHSEEVSKVLEGQKYLPIDHHGA